MTVEALEQYRLKKRDWATTYGQGNPPTHYRKYVDGELVVEWEFGTVAEGSSQTTNMSDYSPGKVKLEHLQELADDGQLEHLPQQ